MITELIEALVDASPVHESPMGYTYCAHCDAENSYGSDVSYRHQWSCAWMRALVHLGRDIPVGHGWGERTWNTAWVDTDNRGWGLYGNVPKVGQRIAYIFRPSMGEETVQTVGLVVEVVDGFPVMRTEDITDLDFGPARARLGFLPCVAWTNLDIVDPRVETISTPNQKGNTE